MKACKTVINLIVNLLKFITYKIMYTKLQLQQALHCIFSFTVNILESQIGSIETFWHNLNYIILLLILVKRFVIDFNKQALY